LPWFELDGAVQTMRCLVVPAGTIQNAAEGRLNLRRKRVELGRPFYLGERLGKTAHRHQQ
jgi:hypothetical protein